MVTSTDGVLTATSDPNGGGVFLRADYSSPWSLKDQFESGVAGWSAVAGTSSVGQTTASPLAGTGSLRWSWTSAGVQTIRRSLTGFPARTFERKVVVTGLISATAVALDITLSMGGVSVVIGCPVQDAGLSRRFVANLYVPAGASVTSLDLTATPATSAANLIRLDEFEIQIIAPLRVSFWRGEMPVRGSSPSAASGGIAYAYDLEARAGVDSSWRVVPTYENRGELTDQAASAPVTLTVPDLTGERSMWLKSVSNPSRSRLVIAMYPAGAVSYAGRTNLTAMPKSGLMSGPWDVPVRQPETWVIKVMDEVELLAIEKLHASGPVLMQHAAGRRLRDTYVMIDSLSSDYQFHALRPERLVTMTVIPIAQPPVDGAPLFIPGRSYADMAAAFPTYASAAGVSYDSLATP